MAAGSKCPASKLTGEANGHRLWVYGGQTSPGVRFSGGGVEDIWVLTMPAFLYGPFFEKPSLLGVVVIIRHH